MSFCDGDKEKDNSVQLVGVKFLKWPVSMIGISLSKSSSSNSFESR